MLSIVVIAIVSFLGMPHAQSKEKIQKTIALPNERVILDINGEGEALVFCIKYLPSSGKLLHKFLISAAALLALLFWSVAVTCSYVSKLQQESLWHE